MNIQVRSSMINRNRDVCSVEGPEHRGPVARAGSGAEGPIAVAQQGLMARRATMTLIGEAGSEAVVPLKGGAIPARLDARGLRAVLPAGQAIPIKLPMLAMGGIAGQPVTPTPPAVLRAPALGDGALGGQRSGVTINFQVHAMDASSFRAS